MEKSTIRSTDEVDGLPFRPHGKVEILSAGGLYQMEATGPFNRELIEALESMEMTVLPEMAAMGRWVEIVVVLNSALASFDTIESFTAYLKRNVARYLNPVGTAFVVAAEVEGASIMVPIYEKCYAAANWRFKAFEKHKDAETWVKSLLVEDVA